MQIDSEEDKTTYRHDYKRFSRHKEDDHWRRASYDEFEKSENKEFVYEDHQTFQKIPPSGQVIPFDLLWKPKPITQTNPHTPIIREEPPEDIFDKKKRPRVVMSPAISLDEAGETLANDPENQDLLIHYTYTTTWKKASQDAGLPTTKRVIPNSALEINADPARFVLEDTNQLPFGWKELALDWDKVQDRLVSDPTRAFWEQNALRVKCGACDANTKSRNLVDPATKQKIEHLIKTDNLHLSRDYPKLGYMGFVPQLPIGIPMEKRHLHSKDPRLSTYQAWSMWKEQRLK